jgi:rod shape determining protein RodA
VILCINSNLFVNLSYIIYGIGILLLIAVLLFGTKISGAKSWIQFGSFSLQPVEFVKFTTSLAVAAFLSRSNANLRKFSNLFAVAMLLLLPIALILLQPDAGSSLIFISFIIVFYREGMSSWLLWILFVAIAIFVLSIAVNIWIVIGFLSVISIVFIWRIKKKTSNIMLVVFLLSASIAFSFASKVVFEKLPDHQKDRINVVLGKKIDPKGVGYNTNQSKIAIGAGRFIGKGYKQGTQTQSNFIPEQHTDFIFTAVGEEFGFIGGLSVLAAFFWLIMSIINAAERQYLKFARIFGYCVASIIFFQVFINIGMVLGILPVIGIPLPFISYGGSSLISMTIMLFVFIRMDAEKANI